MVWRLASYLTQTLPAEAAHNVAVKALSLGMGPAPIVPSLPVKVGEMSWPNPLGLAAGFDKNAEAYHGAHKLGFGAVEVGTITPLAQPGNPKPRVFRLPEDQAVINRYGFNGKGMSYAARQLAKRRSDMILGVNIGANKLSEDKAQDYHKTAAFLAGYADYITVNISSPNTPGLRDLQDGKALKETLAATFAGLADASETKPVFVKLAPDLTATALIQSMEAALAFNIAGFILTNTTIARPSSLQSRHQSEQGGLSGRPVKAFSEASLATAMTFIKEQNAGCDVIAVGGIENAQDVLLRLALGASATQLYSALSLQGPDLPARILTDIAAFCDRHDIASLADIIGTASTIAEARAFAAR